jgi:hypothetical protein
MNVRWMMVAVCGIVALGLGLAANGTRAADANPRPVSAKRQLVMCMTKRMSDSKTLSYNDASKLCKEQLEAQRVTLTSSVLAKPMAP